MEENGHLLAPLFSGFRPVSQLQESLPPQAREKMKDEISLIPGIALSQQKRPFYLLISCLYLSSYFMFKQ